MKYLALLLLLDACQPRGNVDWNLVQYEPEYVETTYTQ